MARVPRARLLVATSLTLFALVGCQVGSASPVSEPGGTTAAPVAAVTVASEPAGSAGSMEPTLTPGPTVTPQPSEPSEPTPAPTEPTAEIGTFAIPFRYPASADARAEKAAWSSSLVAWTWREPPAGPGRPGPEAGDWFYPSDADGALITGSWGIVLAALDPRGVFTHPCPGVDGGPSRVPIRADVTGLVDDLPAVAGVDLALPSETEVDGRPALAFDVDPARNGCTFGDVHVSTTRWGLAAHDYVLLSVPSRLILLDVGGTTVIFQVWAATAAEVATHLPQARQLLDGLHFLVPAGHAPARPRAP